MFVSSDYKRQLKTVGFEVNLILYPNFSLCRHVNCSISIPRCAWLALVIRSDPCCGSHCFWFNCNISCEINSLYKVFHNCWNKAIGHKQGRSQTFSFGGATGGASFATRGAVNDLCRTFRKRPEKFWWGHWGGQAKFWEGSGPPGTPLAPPLGTNPGF